MNARKIADAALPTKFGTFRILGFEDKPGDESVVALVMGTPWLQPSALVRIHAQCLTGENFGFSGCDCGTQLTGALQKIAENGGGVLIYQLAEGRGVGLMNTLEAYRSQGPDPEGGDASHPCGANAERRSLLLCGAVLGSLGIRKIHLMSDDRQQSEGLEEAGIVVVEEIPFRIPASHAHTESPPPMGTGVTPIHGNGTAGIPVRTIVDTSGDERSTAHSL